MRPTGILLVLALVMGFSFAMLPCSDIGGVTIDEPGTYTLNSDITGACVDIFADDVELDCNGHTIDCEMAHIPGIFIDGERQDIEVHDCIVQNCFYGLMFTHIENFMLYDSTFSDNIYGMSNDFKSLIDGTITGNTFSGNAVYGMGLRDVNNTVISDNEFYGNGWQMGAAGALYINHGENLNIEGNEIYDNNESGILVIGGWASSTNVTISENTVYNNNGPGIGVDWIEYSEINDNEIYGNSGPGIAVVTADELTIDPNTIYRNDWEGIYVEDSEDVYILDNVIYENCWDADWPCAGITYDNTDDSTIEGNDVYGHEYTGILITGVHSDDIYLYNNNVYDNEYGIEVDMVDYAADIMIDNCRVYDNWDVGIYLDDCGDCEVFNSWIYGNGWDWDEDSAGLIIDDSGDPHVENTRIYENTYGVQFWDIDEEDWEGYMENVRIYDNVYGLELEYSYVEFDNVQIYGNEHSLALFDSELWGHGLSIYDTENYLYMYDDEEDSELEADDVWLGFDRVYGAWYNYVDLEHHYHINSNNLLIGNNFISFDFDDGLGDFDDPDFVVTQVAGCNGLEHYFDEDFPQSQAEILNDGETFTPDDSSCGGTRARYTIITGATGYAASGWADEYGGGDYEPECTSDSDCDECEYCSIANNVCLPKSDIECTSNSDCGAGGSCEACMCVMEQAEPEPEPEPECTRDADCAAGFTCKNQECVKAAPEPECLKDADCAAGFACVAQKCVEKEPEGPTKEEAEAALQEARDAVNKAKSEGKDTSKAEALLADAEGAFADGDYVETIDLAEKVKLAAQAAVTPPEEDEIMIPSAEELPTAKPPVQPQEEFPWLFVIGGVVIIGIVAWWFFFRGK